MQLADTLTLNQLEMGEQNVELTLKGNAVCEENKQENICRSDCLIDENMKKVLV